MSIFAKFNTRVDKGQLEKDVAEARENSGNFENIPYGIYDVEVENIECKETQKGDPMITVYFSVLEGQYKGRKIFANRVIKVGSTYQGFQMSKAIKLLEDLGTGLDISSHGDFEILEQFAADVFEKIQDLGLEYELNYYADKKGYDQHEINEIFEG